MALRLQLDKRVEAEVVVAQAVLEEMLLAALQVQAGNHILLRPLQVIR